LGESGRSIGDNPDRAGRVDGGSTQAQHGRACHLTFVAVEQGGLEPLHLPPGPDRAGVERQRYERHRPQELDREARDESRRTGIVRLAHVCEQGTRRATVHRTRIPWPASELGRDETISVTLEERAE